MSDSVRLNVVLTPALRESVNKLADRLTRQTKVKHTAQDAVRWAITQALGLKAVSK